MHHTVFFLGMCLLQVIFVTYQYILFRRREFLYYLLYTFCVTTFVTLKAFPQYNPFPILVIETESFTAARSVMLTGYAMYFKFGRHFTETNFRYRALNTQLKVVETIFLCFALTDTTLLLNGMNFYVLEPVSKTIYLLAMPFSVYCILYLVSRKRRLTSIYVIGSGLLLLFASAGFIDRFYISKELHSESYYIAFLELGIFFEFLFLNFGLIYKTRMIQKENLKLEVEKQLELYKQRMQISSDLHDEVGATLSGLAMYSQLTMEQMRKNDTTRVEDSLSVMQQSATEMVYKLSDIVWAVNPAHDSVDQLFRKLKDYAAETGAARNITVACCIPKEITDIELSMESRRNLYLLCKEAVNNAVKYSQCSQLRLEACKTGERIRLVIKDDGIGFTEGLVKKGNGLNNMHQRARDLNGELLISSQRGIGTEVQLELNYPNGVTEGVHRP